MLIPDVRLPEQSTTSQIDLPVYSAGICVYVKPPPTITEMLIDDSVGGMMIYLKARLSG